MERTTLMLPDHTRERLRRIAAERGVSMATIIREAIDEKVGSIRPKPRSIGVGASKTSDTARRTGEERPEPRAWRWILDTGPLYASLDRSDADHPACRALIESSDEPLVIPAPVLVEVDYWIQKRLHPGTLVALMDDIDDGAYVVEDLKAIDYRRVRDLCDRHADADIGFVDAAVMAIVERLDETKLATLDRRHFSLIRPRHRQTIELLPR